MGKVKEKEGEVVPFDHREFSCSVPKASKTTLNKNKKTISVSNSFNYNQIPIKIIASYKEWIKLEKKYFDKNRITFRDIKSFICKRTPKSMIKALELYCKENLSSVSICKNVPQSIDEFTSWCIKNPNDFPGQFYSYYICPAMEISPLCTRKPRRLLYNQLTHNKMLPKAR